METVNGVTIPLLKDACLLHENENKSLLNIAEHEKYSSLLESLLYLAICTCRDISFPVGLFARKIHAPTVRHMELLILILRYVARMVHYGLSTLVRLTCHSSLLKLILTPIGVNTVTLLTPLWDRKSASANHP